jgi:hypothetical protein
MIILGNIIMQHRKDKLLFIVAVLGDTLIPSNNANIASSLQLDENFVTLLTYFGTAAFVVRGN